MYIQAAAVARESPSNIHVCFATQTTAWLFCFCFVCFTSILVLKDFFFRTNQDYFIRLWPDVTKSGRNSRMFHHISLGLCCLCPSRSLTGNKKRTAAFFLFLFFVFNICSTTTFVLQELGDEPGRLRSTLARHNGNDTLPMEVRGGRGAQRYQVRGRRRGGQAVGWTNLL